jgi:hypothetical protein
MLDAYYLAQEVLRVELSVMKLANFRYSVVFWLPYKKLIHNNCTCHKATEKDGSGDWPTITFLENITRHQK